MRGARLALVVTALVGLGAAASIVHATRHGPAVSPDSIAFLRIAHGLPAIDHPEGHFPIGYPAALSALHALGFSWIGAARWLGAGLALANVALASLIAMRMAGPRWAVGVALALAAATGVAPLYAGVLSEPLFITFLLGWILLIESRQPISVAAAGVLASASFLVRYAGVAVLLAGLLVVWSERRRLVTYIGGAALPLVAWGVTRVVAGSAIDRRPSWHPPPGQEVRDSVASTWAWVRGLRSPSVIAGGLVLVAAAVLLVRARRLRGGGAIGAVAACYVAVLGVTVVLLDSQTPLDLRLLAPLQVLVILSLPATSTLPFPRLLAVGVAGIVLMNAATTASILDPLNTDMLRLKDDPIVAATRGLDGAVASNEPGLLWLFADADARAIPKVRDPWTGRANPDVDAEMQRLRSALAGGHLVWLAAYPHGYLPTEEAVVRALRATLVERLPDGTIYEVPP